MKYVNQPVRKTDAMSLVTGKPVYTDDLAPRDCLIVKILRSPHANAWVEDIKTGTAEKVAGIACILTYKDVPQKRFTLAGQTAPEMSPDDRLILDRHVRFVGDAVAIVAGETEEAVDKALKRIRVDYRVETPVLDIHKAKDPLLCPPYIEIASIIFCTDVSSGIIIKCPTSLSPPPFASIVESPVFTQIASLQHKFKFCNASFTSSSA